MEEKVEEQFCDEVTGEFLTDRNIVGTCPRCGAEGAYGDQCEKVKKSKKLLKFTIDDGSLNVTSLLGKVKPGSQVG